MSTCLPSTADSTHWRVPRATYRLQFNRDFTFQQAIETAEYLSELGISDVYASPLFQAAPQSTHGYDICSFEKLNSEIGNEEEFDLFSAHLRQLNLGLLLDMVPNHMSASCSNGWWLDVLERGPESEFAGFFDIDWNPPSPSLKNRVLLPILEDRYVLVLESGKLKLSFAEDRFFISYNDSHFPVATQTLPPDANQNPERILAEFDGDTGNPRSFDRLDALIRQQHYRLAWWKVGSEEINYRRFFDVMELVGLKMENADVFAATHQLLFDLIKAGKITGLRVDHPDGLRNPKQYFERLQSSDALGKPLFIVAEKILTANEMLPNDWPISGTTGYDFLNRVNGLFVDSRNEMALDTIYRDFNGTDLDLRACIYQSKKQILEKSLASELNALTQQLWRLSATSRVGIDLTVQQLKLALVAVIAAFPVYRTYLEDDSSKPSEQDSHVIRQAMAEASSHHPTCGVEVFQYLEKILTLQSSSDSDFERDSHAREFAMRFQQLTGPAMAKGLEDTAFYNYNRLISLNEVGGDPGKFGSSVTDFHQANAAIATRWPHTMLTTATHDTKRGEDARARIDVISEMPVLWSEALARWTNLNADKKGKLDGQAAPTRNDEYLLYQSLIGALPFEIRRSQELKPFRKRVIAFMVKAIKEAKTHTSWTEPNDAYETATINFIEQILSDDANNQFLDDLRTFHRQIAFTGKFNSLAQALLKITVPGVSDFYQGTELWDFSFVDPDNRNAVDYELRKSLLNDLKRRYPSDETNLARFISELLSRSDSGQIKQFVIWRALNLRRERPELFERGAYDPLLSSGEHEKHVCAFVRTWNTQRVITVVPRLVYGLMQTSEEPPVGSDVWADTNLFLPQLRAGEKLRNVFTQEIHEVKEFASKRIPLSRLLSNFPVALLEVLPKT